MRSSPCSIGRRRLGVLFLFSFVGFFSLGPEGVADEGASKRPEYDRAQMLLAQGVWMEAADALTAHLEAHPDDAVARMQLATLLFQLNRDRAAADQASLLYDHEGQHAEARRLLIRIRSRLAQSLDPKNPEDLLHFARLARLLGNIDRAAQAFRAVLALKPNPDVMLELARMYYWDGRLSDAAGPYRDYLEVRPKDYRVRQELGQLLNAARRHADAVEEYRLALYQVGRDADLEMEYGRSLLWNDQADEAMEVFDGILRVHPAHIPARLQRAGIFNTREQYMEAYSDYREILRIQPDQPDAAYRVFEYEHSRVLEIERCRAQLVRQPADVEMRRALIRIFTEQERWADVAKEMQTFLLLYPDDSAMRAQLEDLQAQRHARLVDRLAQIQNGRRRMYDPDFRRYEVWLRYHSNDQQARWQWARHLHYAGQEPEALAVLRAWPTQPPPALVGEMMQNIRSTEGAEAWQEN